MPKIESENKFLTSIKDHNSVLICQNLPICKPRTLLPNINSHSKIEVNWLKMLSAVRENDALTDGRMDRCTDRDIFNAKKIILKLDLFMQSLKKISKEMPKIESEKPIDNFNQGL